MKNSRLKKAAVAALLVTALGGTAQMAQAWYHCYGRYFLLQDVYGYWYHQHQGWYHY